MGGSKLVRNGLGKLLGAIGRMIPIFEQGKGRGIGLSLPSFKARFDQLCQEHLESQRALAFAFIFYDFGDSEIRKVLKDRGVFTQLDRLAGNDLSIFFLHSETRRAIETFNSAFLFKLGIQDNIELPCVVFLNLRTLRYPTSALLN
jgi:hypothetical protein